MNLKSGMTRRDFLRSTAGSVITISALSMSSGLLRAQNSGALKVGLLGDLSGSNQEGGQFLLEAAQLAADIVNELGGMGKTFSVDLIIEDTKTSTSEAVTAANRLISRGDISFVIGPLLSSHHLALQPMFAEAEIPQIIVGSTAREMTDSHDEAPLSIRYSPQDLNQIAPLAKYGIAIRNHTKFFTIAVDNVIGRGAVSALEQVLAPIEGMIVESAFYPFLNQDFSTLVARFKDSDADALLVSDGVPTPVFALVDELTRQGVELERLYGSIVFGGPSFFAQLASQGRADGMIFPWFYDDGSSARSFSGQEPPIEAIAMSEAFQERLGKLPGASGFVQAWGWGAVKLLDQAIGMLASEIGTDELLALDPVLELPAAIINDVILAGSNGTESGAKFQLTFGDSIGFLSCGQGEVKGGPATYQNGSRLLLEDRNWADDLITDLCS